MKLFKSLIALSCACTLLGGPFVTLIPSVHAETVDVPLVEGSVLGVEAVDGGFFKVSLGEGSTVFARLADIYVPSEMVEQYVQLLRELLSSNQSIVASVKVFDDGDHLLYLQIGNQDVREVVLEKGLGQLKLEPILEGSTLEILQHYESLAKESNVGLWASEVIEVPTDTVNSSKVPMLTVSIQYANGQENYSVTVQTNGSQVISNGSSVVVPNATLQPNGVVGAANQNGTNPNQVNGDGASNNNSQNNTSSESSSSAESSTVVDESLIIKDAPKPSGNTKEYVDPESGMKIYEVLPDLDAWNKSLEKREYYGETSKGEVVYRKTSPTNGSSYHTLSGRELTADELVGIKPAQVNRQNASNTSNQSQTNGSLFNPDVPQLPAGPIQIVKVDRPKPYDERYQAGIDYCDALALQGIVHVVKGDVNYRELADPNGNGVACELGGEESSYAEIRNGVVLSVNTASNDSGLQPIGQLNGDSGLKPLGQLNGDSGLKPLDQLNGDGDSGLKPLDSSGSSDNFLSGLFGNSSTSDSELKPLNGASVSLPETGEGDVLFYLFVSIFVSLLGMFVFSRSSSIED